MKSGSAPRGSWPLPADRDQRPFFDSRLAGSMTSEALKILSSIPLFAGRSFARLEIGRLGGLTNRAFKIVADGEAFVLRIPGAGTEQHIDRRSESHNLRIAGAIGLAPEVVYLDDDSGVLMTRFVVDGTALTPAATKDREILRAAVLTLRRLHHCGQAFAGVLDPFDKIEHYLSVAARVGTLAMPADLPQAMLAARGLHRWLNKEMRVPTPCHIDPSPENMILRERDGERTVVMFDWEYSAMCDPMWDLADFSMESDLTGDQDNELLEIYFGSDSGLQLERLKQFKSVCYLTGATWALMQAAVTGRQTDFMADYHADMAQFRRGVAAQ
jgi:thiamine kinase-like enzyme